VTEPLKHDAEAPPCSGNGEHPDPATGVVGDTGYRESKEGIGDANGVARLDSILSRSQGQGLDDLNLEVGENEFVELGDEIVEE
jgi:hypothetical protein